MLARVQQHWKQHFTCDDENNEKTGNACLIISDSCFVELCNSIYYYILLFVRLVGLTCVE